MYEFKSVKVKGLTEARKKVKELNQPVAILVDGDYEKYTTLDMMNLDPDTEFEIFTLDDLEDNEQEKVLNTFVNRIIKPTRMNIANRVAVEKYDDKDQFTEEQVELIKKELQFWLIYNPGHSLFCLGYRGFLLEPSAEMTNHLPVLTLDEKAILFKDKSFNVKDEVKEELINKFPILEDVIKRLQFCYRIYFNDDLLGLKSLDLVGMSNLPVIETITVRELGTNTEFLLEDNFTELTQVDDQPVLGQHILVHKLEEQDDEDTITSNGFYLPLEDNKYIYNITGKVVTLDNLDNFYILQVGG